MFRTKVDLSTGMVSKVYLTPEEVADAKARTEAENAPTPEKTMALIAQKERDAMMPRALREFVLSRLSAEEIATNPGFQGIKALDDDIALLRSRM